MADQPQERRNILRADVVPGADGLTRRSFLERCAAGAVMAAIGLPALLAACGSGSSATTGSAAGAPSSGAGAPASSAAVSAGSASASGSAAARPKKVALPAYLPVQGPKPDLPGTADGLDPGFTKFPTKLFKSVNNPPGKGGTATITTWITTPPPPPVDQNAGWQQINKELGLDLQVTMVPFADYRQTRFATMVAGGDLPDAFFVPPRPPVDQLPAFLQNQCADLTPFLSGDAVKEFPNLANIPTFSWKSMVYGGRIYGIPVPSGWYTAAVFVHQEFLDKAGVSHPKTAEEFKKVAQELTHADQNRWAIAIEQGVAYGAGESFTPPFFRAPNGWALDSSGKLTRQYEANEMKAAVSYTADLYKAGVFAVSNNNVASKGDFIARKGVMRFDGWGAWSQYWDAVSKYTPPGKLTSLTPFGANGGKPGYYLGSGSFGFTALKKASPDRVKEMLGVLNFLAAPFGSEEWMLLNFGAKDADYTFDASGDPKLTAKGQNDTKIPWRYITQSPPALYKSAAPEYPRIIQEGEKAMLAAGMTDPTIGFYSPTDSSKGTSLNQTFVDGINDIVAARRPLSDYDQLVKDWRTNGGDKIRAEYEQAIAAAG